MLRGIHASLSPDLLYVLACMGHGDDIVLADAHFPGHSVGNRVVRADGVDIDTLLEGILPLFPLDRYASPLAMMAVVDGDTVDPAVEAGYVRLIDRFEPDAPAPDRLERFAFYDRARTAYVVVMSGDRRPYANLVLKKGVVLP